MATRTPFFVPGIPKPKGSWTPVWNAKKRVTKFRPASKYTADWCARAKEVFERRWKHPIIVDGPVKVDTLFLLPRLKTVVRKWPTGKFEGDLDKLERAVFDAMSGVVYTDDRQVVTGSRTKKYTDAAPGVWVTISTDGL